jgi:hypothetical protein
MKKINLSQSMTRYSSAKSYGDHAALICRVTIKWNTVQMMVYLLFRQLCKLPSDQAQAIFFGLKADSAQRDITRDLAAVVLAPHKALADRTKTAISNLDRLAGERNAAVHTMWAVMSLEGDVTPVPGLRHHGKLEKDFTSQFQRLERDLSTLLEQFLELRNDIAAQASLPKILPIPPPEHPSPAEDGPSDA